MSTIDHREAPRGANPAMESQAGEALSAGSENESPQIVAPDLLDTGPADTGPTDVAQGEARPGDAVPGVSGVLGVPSVPGIFDNPDGPEPLGPVPLGEAATTPDGDAPGVVLGLDDLLPDEAGEVVLFTGNDVAINLLADVPVTASGVADQHVTAGGLEVTGLHYYTFEGGITVYSPSDLLIVHDDTLFTG